MSTSPQSEAFTALLWGDSWWLPGGAEPVAFGQIEHAAGALIAALAGDAPRRLRLIYQPDRFASVVTPCPHAGRRTLALALQEQFPGLATGEIAWSHEPILPLGESFTTILHYESSPALFALIAHLADFGIAVESVWPLPTWLHSLSQVWSESGATTVLALAGGRACAYHHPAAGTRQVITWPAGDATAPELWLGNLLDRDPAEPVLVVTDLPSADGVVSPSPERPGLQHLPLADALARAATMPSRHPAQLRPPAPLVTAPRAVLVASLLLLAATGVSVTPWALAHGSARREALVRTDREQVLLAEVAHLRANAADIAALHRKRDEQKPPFAGPLLRQLAATIPPEITLAGVQGVAGGFTAQGFVAPTTTGDVLDRWTQALARTDVRRLVRTEVPAKNSSAFRLIGEIKP